MVEIFDWLYVDDHIEGILLALCNGKVGESYCIGGNNEISKQLVLNMFYFGRIETYKNKLC